MKEERNYEVGEIRIGDVEIGEGVIEVKLEEFKENKIRYVVVDCREEGDLEMILEMSGEVEYSFGWGGCGGIGNYVRGD
ncbi:hypothetical protein [Paenibacillus xylanexedens]|uniref:hypothetical protein n=1 Tax=Paenibacillus xylanexedens TaxID=528191 RepID=UPI0034D97BE0